VTFTETPGAGSAFGGWNDECAARGFNTSCMLTANQNRFVSAAFFKPVTLLVTRTGSGGGTITSSPAGITCGADCSQPYAFNTVVTLTAAAAAGSVFGGFTGCDSLVGNFSCRLTMTANRTVFASFTPPTAALGVSTSGNGNVSGPGIDCGGGGSDCLQGFPTGAAVVLTAALDLVSFAGSGVYTGIDGDCTFLDNDTTVMDHACTVTRASMPPRDRHDPGSVTRLTRS